MHLTNKKAASGLKSDGSRDCRLVEIIIAVVVSSSHALDDHICCAASNIPSLG